MIAVAACGATQHNLTPGDGPQSGDDGGAVDAGPDASQPPDLVAMCGAAPVTLADWEQCYAKRYCETLVHCSELNLYRDAAECIAQENAVEGGKPAFDAFERARAVAAGRASLDPVAFTQCLGELSTTKCATAAFAPSCKERFVGTIADGASCYTDIECASPGATCEQPATCTESCCLGVCTPKPKLGEACDDFVNGCEPGVVCGTDLTCVNGDIGSPCKRYDCVPGAWCDNGTCKADLAEGGACNSLLQCGGEMSCVGLKITTQPATCRRVTQPGDTCDWFCLGNLYCDTSGSTGFGVCRPIPVHGQACTALLPCLGADQICTNGQCVDRTAVGQACTDGTCMPGLFCSDQVGAANPVCTAPLAAGVLGCKQPSQCQSYVCDGNANTLGNCQPSQDTCP